MEISRSGLADFAAAFVRDLPLAAGKGAYIVGLSGELGAGKTTFVQEVAKALGVTAPVTSPTFVIVQSYAINHGPFRHLVHVDAYRFSPTDRDTIGWSEHARDPQNLILAEWPERLPGGMPAGIETLEFTVTSDSTREIVQKHGG